MIATTTTPRTPLVSTHRALISAHRGGPLSFGFPDNSAAAIHEASRSDSDFVEFDVRMAHDGTFVIHHDDHDGLSEQPINSLHGNELSHLPRLDDVADVMASHSTAHIDVKSLARANSDALYSDVERFARQITALFPRFLVTTDDIRTCRMLAKWAARNKTPMPVGFSLWSPVSWGHVRHGYGVRPLTRFQRSLASILVIHRTLARDRLLTWASARRIPVLVYTCDRQTDLERFMFDPRVWAVTTNRPLFALSLNSDAIAADRDRSSAQPQDLHA